MRSVSITLIFSFLMLHSLASNGATLDVVKKRGHLKCGVTAGVVGFSAPNDKGEWTGLEVEICRAVATAVLNDPKKVKFISLNAQQRFTALQSGEIDLLSRVTTHTLSRDTSLGLNFAPVTYYDGQGFLVRKKDGVQTVYDLNGASICTQQGTTSELNLTDFFRSKQMKFKPVIFESNEETVAAFAKGRCDAFTTDSSGLVSEKSKLKNSEQYTILKDIISKEPLAPAVRHGDDQWFDIVKWTIYGLINAEEFGITSKNIDSFKKKTDPRIRRFLGENPGNGKALGLSEDWAYNVIKKVGNYSEIFERNLGESTPLKLQRGMNDLWTNGGLLYAPPMR